MRRISATLEVVTPSTPFIAWPGKWGASSSSPAAPRRQGKWGDPNGFNAGVAPCTVGTAQAVATASARRLGSRVPAPRIGATLVEGRAWVRYSLERPGRRRLTLLISIAREGAPDVAVARRVRGRDGVASFRLPPDTGAPYVVSASAFSRRGARSDVIRATLR